MLNILFWDHEVSPNQIDALNNSSSWTLMFLTYGSYTLTIEQEKVTLIKGDLMLIPPGKKFLATMNPLNHHEKFTVTFEKKYEGPLLPLLEQTNYIFSNTGMFELIYDRFLFIQNQWIDKLPYCQLLTTIVASL